MNGPAFLNTVTNRMHSLPVVILYVTAGCNLRCVMCSYREPLPNELNLREIQQIAEDLRTLGLRHIVYSGGEPLLRRDFPDICRTFSALNVRQTLLTNGLLLHKRMPEIEGLLDEVIVSIDGPDPFVHNSIRGIEAFEQIVRGVSTLLSLRERPKVSIRTVLQKQNFRHVGRMIEWARGLGVDRLSFLSADVESGAFHRDLDGSVPAKERILLNRGEAMAFRTIVTEVVARHRQAFDTSFVSETPEKMFHIVQYFEAVNGLAPFPRNRCNAPMISTVITSTGDLLPCYFLPAYGNIRSGALQQQINSHRAMENRKEVKAYSLKQCQTCVCTLHVSPLTALRDVW